MGKLKSLKEFKDLVINKKIISVHPQCEYMHQTHTINVLNTASTRIYQKVKYHMEHTNSAPTPPPFLTLLPNPLQSDTEPLPTDAKLIKFNTWQSLVDLSNRSSTNVGMSDETTHTEVSPNANAPPLHTSQIETPTVSHISHEAAPTISIPSAPIVDELIYGGDPIHSPSTDSSHIDFIVPPIERIIINNGENEEDGGRNISSSTCVICLDKPVECACIPCGHMAGCMLCLKEIKLRRGKCPICRAKIDQVVRFYAV